ncbi:MAG: MFS transporter [Candidatus Abyssubacteria bacterium]
MAEELYKIDALRSAHRAMALQPRGEIILAARGGKGGIYYGWYIVAASFLILFITTGIGFYTFSVFMLPLEKFFGASRTEIASYASLMALVAGFATPLIGWLYHAWGPRKVIGFGAVVVASGYLLLSRSTQVWHLYAIAVLVGVGLSATTLIPNQTIISHWFVKKRGRAMGIMMMGIALGGIVWAPLAHDLIERFQWQGAFVIFGLAIAAIVVPIALLVLRPSPQSMGLAPDGVDLPTDGGTAALHANVERLAGPGLTVQQAVRTVPFWSMFAINFFMILGTSIVTLHIVGIVTASPFGVAKGTEAAMLIGSRAIRDFLIVSVAGRFLGGYVAERFSKRYVLFGLYLIMIGSAVLLFRLDNATAFYAFILLYGLGMGGSAVVYPLLLAENFGLGSFSKLLGIMGIAFTLGAAIGQVGAAKIYDGTGSYTGVFVLLIGVFAVSSALTLLSRPPRNSPCPETA